MAVTRLGGGLYWARALSLNDHLPSRCSISCQFPLAKATESFELCHLFGQSQLSKTEARCEPPQQTRTALRQRRGPYMSGSGAASSLACPTGLVGLVGG